MIHSVENVEKMFNDEIREKKRIGRGSYARRGKGVKHGLSGALKTPYYYMSAKERKKLNGKVEVFHMNDTIIRLEEFDQKDAETQKDLLMRWRELYPTEQIKREMKISHSHFYTLLDKLKIPKNKGTFKNTSKKPKKLVTPAERLKSLAVSAEKEDKPAVQEQAPIQRLVPNGLHLEFNGAYDAEALNKLFTKLQLLLDGETNDYQIYLSLTEKHKK